jgi:hypothetical protein
MGITHEQLCIVAEKLTGWVYEPFCVSTKREPEWMNDICPDGVPPGYRYNWVLCHKLGWLMYNKPGWVANNRPDLMLRYRPGWMKTHRKAYIERLTYENFSTYK